VSGAPPAGQGNASHDSEDVSFFGKEVVRLHNRLRAKHNAQPLTLSKRLTAHAQEWADKLAAEGRFEHRPDGQYGENLYCMWSSGGGHASVSE